MRVILLFDNDGLDNCYREYNLQDHFDVDLRNGKMVKLAFCHPDHGEQMMAKCEEMLSE